MQLIVQIMKSVLGLLAQLGVNGGEAHDAAKGGIIKAEDLAVLRDGFAGLAQGRDKIGRDIIGIDNHRWWPLGIGEPLLRCFDAGAGLDWAEHLPALINPRMGIGKGLNRPQPRLSICAAGSAQHMTNAREVLGGKIG